MDMATNYIGQSLGKETRDSYMMLAQTLLLVDGGYKYLNGEKKKTIIIVLHLTSQIAPR